MTSYIDHKRGCYEIGHGGAQEVTHSWTEHTAQRLEWLYGPERARDNFIPSKNADLRAWLSLGKGMAA